MKFLKSLVLATAVGVAGFTAGQVRAVEFTLWVTDDVTKTVYELAADGSEILFTFNTPRPRDYSSIAVDPFDDTLWITSEGGPLPGRIFNVERDGTVLSQFDFGAMPEGIVVDPADDSLWVPDDAAEVIYNIEKDGTFIRSFPTSVYDSGSANPQAIAIDPLTESLWISDSAADAVYNITKAGELLSSFRASGIDPNYDGTFFNVQGLSFDEISRSLWITSRATATVYNATTYGIQRTSFSSDAFDAAAVSLTGIAYDDAVGDGIGLGDAAPFAVLALPGAEFVLKDGQRGTGIVGEVGLGPAAEQKFDHGLLTGNYLVDPDGDDSNENDVVISARTLSADLSSATTDALAAADAVAALAPTQVFQDINRNTTITGTAGLNVIQADKIELDEETLTLLGDESSFFVFKLRKGIKLKSGSAVILDGGVAASNVLFVIEGDEDSVIEKASYGVGTILAPQGNVKIKNRGSLLVGSILGGNEIKLEDGGRLRSPGRLLPVGVLGPAAAATTLALPGAKLKISDDDTTVLGDVFLGPFAEQKFSRGLIDGNYLVDPAADNSHDHDVFITGEARETSLSQSAADALDAAAVVAHLSPSQVHGEVKNSTTIVGTPGQNVIEVKKIELDDAETLTLVGSPSSQFIFQVSEKVVLKNESAIVLSGGVLERDVLFVVFDDKDSVVESGSVARGTLLSPIGKVKVRGANSVLIGAAIAGNEIVIENGGSLESPD